MLESRPDNYGWTKERILRLMLHPWLGLPSTKSLNYIAENANASYGWVHKVWEDLIAVGAFRAPPANTLIDPVPAFDYWLKLRRDNRPGRVQRDYHVLGGLEFLKGIVSNRGMEYAATTYLAENMVQGHLFPRRFDLYVRASQQAAWHQAFSSRGFPVDSNADDRGIIRLITSEMDVQNPRDPTKDLNDVSEIVDEVAPVPVRGQHRPARRGEPIRDDYIHWHNKQWLNPVRDIWVVQPPLLIVDLLEEGGAAAEAAEMLMRRTYAHRAVHRS